MNEALIIENLSAALALILYLSLPPIVVAAVVGVLVSFVQALTQIQEQTLSFGIKLTAVTLTLFFIGPWLGAELLAFCLLMFERFPEYTR